jgi:hypothetical protein
VYFQLLPAVATLSSYGAVKLETENGKLKSCESCLPAEALAKEG